MLEKGSVPGSQKNSASLLKPEGVIARVAFFLRHKRRRARFVIRVPKLYPIGKVFYTVESPIEPITFTNKKEAKGLQRLLRRSTLQLKSDIVRREVTDDGYEPTYGDTK